MKKVLLAFTVLFLPIAATAQIIPSPGTLRIQGTAGGSNVGDPVSVVLTDGSGGTAGGMVQGNAGSSTTDSGNPVKFGCVYNSSSPVFTTGQRADCQADANGFLSVRLSGLSSNLGDGVSNSVITGRNDAGAPRLPVYGVYNFNGSTFDRARNIGDTASAGVGVAATAVSPHSAAGGAIVPQSSPSAEASRTFKASAGNLYRVSITTGATGGYLMVFNATTAPVDGAVTPAICRVIAANSSLSVTFADVPARLTTGITAVFSSTGCFTKTASATAFFEGYAV